MSEIRQKRKYRKKDVEEYLPIPKQVKDLRKVFSPGMKIAYSKTGGQDDDRYTKVSGKATVVKVYPKMIVTVLHSKSRITECFCIGEYISGKIKEVKKR